MDLTSAPDQTQIPFEFDPYSCTGVNLPRWIDRTGQGLVLGTRCAVYDASEWASAGIGLVKLEQQAQKLQQEYQKLSERGYGLNVTDADVQRLKALEEQIASFCRTRFSP